MKRTLIALLSLLLTAGPLAAAESDDLFASGAALVEAHCGECDGATRAGLESGIAALRQAIDLGYANPIAAYKLLADAYATMAWVHSPIESAAQQSYLTLQDAAYQQLIALAPNDAAIRLEYATFLVDPVARLPHAEAAVSLAPQSANAHFVLAVTLVATQQYAASMDAADTAIAYATVEEANKYASYLSGMYLAAGMTAESTLVLDEAKRKNG